MLVVVAVATHSFGKKFVPLIKRIAGDRNFFSALDVVRLNKVLTFSKK